jgi:hypothetical protein
VLGEPLLCCEHKGTFLFEFRRYVAGVSELVFDISANREAWLRNWNCPEIIAVIRGFGASVPTIQWQVRTVWPS